MLTLAVASATASTTPSGPNIPHFDKIAHFFIFGLLGTLLFRLVRRMDGVRRRWLWALLGVALYGAGDELLQSFNVARSLDPLDWVADLSGAAFAIVMYRKAGWYRRLLEMPLWGRRLAKGETNSSNAPR